MSHHAKVLVGAGLFTRQERGKWAYYALADGGLENLAAATVHPTR